VVIEGEVTRDDLKLLVSLDFEVGLIIREGETILFTSGSEDELGVLASVRRLAQEADFIVHTHLEGEEPSALDIHNAVSETEQEYVLTNRGVYVYNRDGLLNSGVPKDFKYFLEQYAEALKESEAHADFMQARESLNIFIAEQDRYNEASEEERIVFRASAPGYPADIHTTYDPNKLRPLSELQALVDAAQAGDTILLDDVAYLVEPNKPLVINKDGITLRAKNNRKVFLVRTAAENASASYLTKALVYAPANNITLDGLVLKGPDTASMSYAGFIPQGNDNKFINGTIEGIYHTGLGYGIMVANGSQNFEVSHSIMRRNRHGIATSSNTVQSISGTKILYNRFTDMEDDLVDNHRGATGTQVIGNYIEDGPLASKKTAGITMQGTEGLVIRDNVIKNNGMIQIGVWVQFIPGGLETGITNVEISGNRMLGSGYTHGIQIDGRVDPEPANLPVDVVIGPGNYVESASNGAIYYKRNSSSERYIDYKNDILPGHLTAPPTEFVPSIVIPAPGVDALPEYVNTGTLVLRGTKAAGTGIWINGEEKVPGDSLTTWSYEVTMSGEGLHTFSVITKDAAGNESVAVVVQVTFQVNSLTELPEATPFVKGTSEAIWAENMAGAGVVATDGKYLYVKRWGSYGGSDDVFQRIGTGFAGTVRGKNYGAVSSSTNSLSATYHDGYLYNPLKGDPYHLERIDVITGAKDQVLVPEGLLERSTGQVRTGWQMITSDGEYLYNVSYHIDGGSSGTYNGWTVRVLDPANGFQKVREYTVATSSFYTDGVMADGEYLYTIEWGGGDAARVVASRLDNAEVVRTWTLNQGTTDIITGQYDAVNGKFWMGALRNNGIYEYDGFRAVEREVAVPVMEALPEYVNTGTLVLRGTKEAGSAIWIDGEEKVAADSSTTWSYEISLFGDGLHTFSLTAKDAHGNVSPAVTVATTLDQTPPAIVFTSPTLTNQSSYTLTYTADGVAKSVVQSLTEGANVLSVTWSDAAGNSTTANLTVTLDTIAPAIVFSSPTLTNQSSYTLTYTADGVAKSVVQSLTEGANVLSVTWSDAAGNSTTANLTVTLDTIAPAIVFTSPTILTGDPSYTLTYTVDGVEKTEVRTLTEGVNVLSVTERDAAGNETVAEYQVTFQATSITELPEESPFVKGTSEAIWAKNMEGAGVVATDGKYLYVKRWSTYGGSDDVFQRIGTGYGGTVRGKNYGAVSSSTISLSATYHDGYLYNPLKGDPYHLERIDVITGAKDQVLVPEGLLERSSGQVRTGWQMITSDGEYLYNVSYHIDGGSSGTYNGWTVRVLDPANGFQKVREYTVETSSFYTDGVMVDGEHLYVIEWGGGDAARVVASRLDNGEVVRTWTLNQGTTDIITGQYDAVNGKFWMGALRNNGIYEYDGFRAIQGVISIEAEAGTFSGSFAVLDGSIYQTETTTDVSEGARVEYQFEVTVSGEFVISGLVNAADFGSDSFYVNIDGEPTNEMLWDVKVTTGFEERLISWRGNGTPTESQFVPAVFYLSAGTHTLVIIGRESNTFLDKVEIIAYDGPQPVSEIIIFLDSDGYCSNDPLDPDCLLTV